MIIRYAFTTNIINDASRSVYDACKSVINNARVTLQNVASLL